jgi:protein TonB
MKAMVAVKVSYGWRLACLLGALLAHYWLLKSIQPSWLAATSPQQTGEGIALTVSFAKPASQPEIQSAELGQQSLPLDQPLVTNNKVQANNQPAKKAPSMVAKKSRPSALTRPQTTRQTSQPQAEVNSRAADKAGNTRKTMEVKQGGHTLPLVTEPLFAVPPKPPRYPAIARKRGQQGTVWLEVWLDKRGQQAKQMIVQSSGVAVLDQAALQSVKGWRFRPYQINGVPVASRVKVPIRFVLS